MHFTDTGCLNLQNSPVCETCPVSSLTKEEAKGKRIKVTDLRPNSKSGSGDRDRWFIDGSEIQNSVPS